MTQPLRVLIDIVHPADVLFFKRPIDLFRDAGDEVRVVSREKDVTGALLDGFGIPHRPISRQGRGTAGLAAELVRRDLALLGVARRFRPDVMLGFGGIAISHVGSFLRIPSVSFYDSENATLQTRITWPFITRLVVPEDYDGPVPHGRTDRLPGTKDLSYFHPSAFRPDRERALAQGLDPDRPNVFLRFVRWGANHDIGKGGWTGAEAQRLVDALASRARLHVSAEADVPEPLRPHLWQGNPREVHHLLGHADAYLGESATMACEAVAMGVPALYAGVDFPGYTRGLARRGLLRLLRPEARSTLADEATRLLDDRAGFEARQRDWIARCPDWAHAVVETARRTAKRRDA